jgi:hypothetical protein
MRTGAGEVLWVLKNLPLSFFLCGNMVFIRGRNKSLPLCATDNPLPLLIAPLVTATHFPEMPTGAGEVYEVL